MNKIILTVMAVCLLVGFTACGQKDGTSKAVATVHNSQNSLDWAGVYRSLYQLANYRGYSATTITLNSDGTFEISNLLLGNDGKVVDRSVIKIAGKFSWDKTGSIIILDIERAQLYKGREGHSKQGFEQWHYRVEEGRLRELDLQGNVTSTLDKIK